MWVGNIGGICDKASLPSRVRASSTLKPNHAINAGLVSVFSGAGGMDLGFSQEGFATLLAADYMPAAVASFNLNHGDGIAVELDLLKRNSRSVVKAVSEKTAGSGPPVRGVIGGPPCQGVSSGNNSSGPIDPRNRLFSRYINLVLKLDDVFKLDFFVFENVPGLKLRKNEALYKSLISRLGARFNLHEKIVDASKYGVPQVRKRLIIVGIHKRTGVSNYVFPPELDQTIPPTVRRAISGLPEPSFFCRNEKINNSYHPNHWTTAPVSGKFSLKSPYVTPPNSRSFIRLDWDKPSRTVAYGNREIHLHPDGRRRLSIYEAMQLQGFPHTFELSGNLSEQVTQVSNAVPPPVARAIARSLAETLYKDVRGARDV